MPIRIPNTLPSVSILQDENVFVMTDERAVSQDIRPLEIAIFNIMPTKIETETQLLRLLSNTPLQVNISLIHPKTHQSKNTPIEHLQAFYKTFDDIKNKKFDGMIITGAPVESLDFTDVIYWDEFTEVLEWSKSNVFSTFHICWGAQAGLYYHYGIKKHSLDNKLSGVFLHKVLNHKVQLLRGFDDYFYYPHSRHAQINPEDIKDVEGLEIIAYSKDAGVGIAMTDDGRQIYVTGHGEYTSETLKKEYERDLIKNIDNVAVPENYFPDDDPSNTPNVKWRAHASLLFTNWLNYYVYQETPYNLEEVGNKH